MEDRTDRKSSKFLTVQYRVTWFAAPFGMFVCFAIATKTAGIIGLLFTLLLAWNIYRHYSDGNFPESKSGEDLYRLRSTDILRLMFREELTGLYPDGKMLPLGAAVRRTLLAVLWAALNLAVILSSYYKPGVYTGTSLLFLFFVWRFCANGTYFYLIRKAKHSRDVPLREIVGKVTGNGGDKGRHPVLLVISAAAILFSFGIFCKTTASLRIIYEECPGGYAVGKCYPPLSGIDEVEIPTTYNGSAVVAIGDYAFRDISSMERVGIPDTVTQIGSGAFSGCRALYDITLPDRLTSLGGEAFKNCSSLRSVVIPRGVTELRGNTFEGCGSLRSVTLHDGITAIHGYAFVSCSSLREITLPETITEIRAYTFSGCSSLQSVRIPEGVTRIAAHAFYGCSALSEVTVPDSVTEIGSSAFRKCTHLWEIELPETVSVNERAFKESPTSIRYRAVRQAEY